MTEVINDILECDRKIYMAITGGGTRAISELLERGGASSVFMGARVPYSIEDLSDFIGSVGPDEKCCSINMADRLCQAAMYTAFSNNCEEDKIVGLGCTASLTKLRKGVDEREGRVNQAFIQVSSKYKIAETHIVFHNNDKYHTLSRRDQEDMLSTLILSALADFVNPSKKYVYSHHQSNPYVKVQSQSHKLDF